jgi:hypothetical protein
MSEDNIPDTSEVNVSQNTQKEDELQTQELEALEAEIFSAAEESVKSEVALPSSEAGVNSGVSAKDEKDSEGGSGAKVKSTSSRGRVPRKQELIDSIKKLYDKMEKPYPLTENQFKRTRNDELEKMLAETMEEAHKTVIQQQVRDEGVKEQEVNRAQFGALLLWRTQTIALQGLELVSDKYSDKLGTSLVGVTDDVEKEREQIMELLKQIYLEHGTALNEYMSPVSVYLFTMMTITMRRLGENFRKGSKDESKEE